MQDELPSSVHFIRTFFGINNDKIKEMTVGKGGATSYVSHLKILYSNL